MPDLKHSPIFSDFPQRREQEETQQTTARRLNRVFMRNDTFLHSIPSSIFHFYSLPLVPCCNCDSAIMSYHRALKCCVCSENNATRPTRPFLLHSFHSTCTPQPASVSSLALQYSQCLASHPSPRKSSSHQFNIVACL